MSREHGDLDRLEQLAREATPGPWGTNGAFVKSASVMVADAGYPTPAALADAVYIAALDPATVLELVAAARLGAAWQEAEAALPEGWRLQGFSPIAGKWHAMALGGHTEARCDQGTVHREFEKATALEATPAAALLALAEALRERATP